MEFKEFKRKVNTVYHDKKITFERNEVQNAARIGEWVIWNNVSSDLVYIIGANSPAFSGRAFSVETA